MRAVGDTPFNYTWSRERAKVIELYGSASIHSQPTKDHARTRKQLFCQKNEGDYSYQFCCRPFDKEQEDIAFLPVCHCSGVFYEV